MRAKDCARPEASTCAGSYNNPLAAAASYTMVGRRVLSETLLATLLGPAAISVSQARVEEAAGADVAFAVTLSRAASSRVTVDYATRDGSAHAGSDYTATSGTVTFQAGDTSQTIAVSVLDDAPDEGRGDVHPGAVERVGRVA